MTKYKLFLLAGILLVIDQVTKTWAVGHSQVSFNAGVSFGLAPVWGSVIHALGLVALLASILVVKMRRRYGAAIYLVGVGGLSNMLDRVRWGAVVDWLQIPGTNLQNNVADYVIMVGLLWLLGVIMYDTYVAA